MGTLNILSILIYLDSKRLAYIVPIYIGLRIDIIAKLMTLILCLDSMVY